MGKMISISEASKITGVTVKTLKIWDNEGLLKAKYKTAGGHRRYDSDDIEKYIGNDISKEKQQNAFIYCRVSTKKQQESGNLQRQKERLVKYCNEKQYNIVEVFEEVASGINDNRKELIKMFRRLDEIKYIVIEYDDRLARFGYNYLKEYAKSFNVEVEVVEHTEKKDVNEEMVNDLISIITCSIAKLYGSEGGKKIQKAIQKSIQEIKDERDENSENNDTSSII
ncbi:MAG: IS607 family transposase [Tissierellia bacterium]|nr:IS607 family transposase [Tissierellia bacterium]